MPETEEFQFQLAKAEFIRRNLMTEEDFGEESVLRRIMSKKEIIALEDEVTRKVTSEAGDIVTIPNQGRYGIKYSKERLRNGSNSRLEEMSDELAFITTSGTDDKSDKRQLRLQFIYKCSQNPMIKILYSFAYNFYHFVEKLGKQYSGVGQNESNLLCTVTGGNLIIYFAIFIRNIIKHYRAPQQSALMFEVKKILNALVIFLNKNGCNLSINNIMKIITDHFKAVEEVELESIATNGNSDPDWKLGLNINPKLRDNYIPPELADVKKWLSSKGYITTEANAKANANADAYAYADIVKKADDYTVEPFALTRAKYLLYEDEEKIGLDRKAAINKSEAIKKKDEKLRAFCYRFKITYPTEVEFSPEVISEIYVTRMKKVYLEMVEKEFEMVEKEFEASKTLDNKEWKDYIKERKDNIKKCWKFLKKLALRKKSGELDTKLTIGEISKLYMRTQPTALPTAPPRAPLTTESFHGDADAAMVDAHTHANVAEADADEDAEKAMVDADDDDADEDADEDADAFTDDVTASQASALSFEDLNYIPEDHAVKKEDSTPNVEILVEGLDKFELAAQGFLAYTKIYTDHINTIIEDELKKKKLTYQQLYDCLSTIKSIMSEQDMFIPKLLGIIIKKILTEENKFRTKEIINAVTQAHSNKNQETYTLAHCKVETDSDDRNKPEITNGLKAFEEKVKPDYQNPDGVLVLMLVITGEPKPKKNPKKIKGGGMRKVRVKKTRTMRRNQQKTRKVNKANKFRKQRKSRKVRKARKSRKSRKVRKYKV
jgi:hypothetical protein